MIAPIHVLSLGAGVQSSTLALMAAYGEITPMPAAAIFADTQDEPRDVYLWLDWLESQLPFPLHRVTAGRLSTDALAIQVNKKTKREYYSNRIPAFVKSKGSASEGKVDRHCTHDFKIRPIIQATRRLVPDEIYRAWRKKHRAELRDIAAYELEKQRARKEEREINPAIASASYGAFANCQDDPLVIQWIWISRDEIVRMKPSREPWIKHAWPLVFDKAMRRHDCLRWWDEGGHFDGKAMPFARPPRSACIFCPFKSNAEWRRLRDESPGEFAAAAEFERQLQHTQSGVETPGKIRGTPYLHRSLVPLEQVDLSTEAERGQDDLFAAAGGFANECEGMCGV